jgi:hypothetical protein
MADSIPNQNNPNSVNPSSQPASAGTGNASGTQSGPAIAAATNGVMNQAQAYSSPAKNTAGIEANNKLAGDDYSLRKNALSQDNNTQKVALVGRTGTGSTQLSPGNTDVFAMNDGSGKAVTSAVVFEATPDMNESGRTILVDIGDIRAAASIVFYMGSPSRSFSLNAKFISRTQTEANQNWTYINYLKAWRMPTLKAGSAQNAEPETLRLYAYGNILQGIPVMLESLNIEYSSEVDYIQTDADHGSSWLPIVQNIQINLKEVRSSDDLASFDYTKFKTGKLEQW